MPYDYNFLLVAYVFIEVVHFMHVVIHIICSSYSQPSRAVCLLSGWWLGSATHASAFNGVVMCMHYHASSC